MKKTVYIHIGPGKSGTSAIQSFLAKNNETLKKYGYFYPEIDDIFSSSKGVVTGGNSATLAKSFLAKDHPFSINEAEKSNIVDKFKRVLSSTSYNIILSSELFSMLNSEQVLRLKSIIKDYDYDISFICYLRRHDEIIESDYAQQIKMHKHSRPIDEEYFNRIIHSYDFTRIINQFENSLGKDSAIIRVYEKQQFKDNNLLVDFLFALGLYHEVDSFIFSNSIINPSPSSGLPPKN